MSSYGTRFAVVFLDSGPAGTSTPFCDPFRFRAATRRRSICNIGFTLEMELREQDIILVSVGSHGDVY